MPSLYINTENGKYYVSHTLPVPDTLVEVDNSRMYMMLNNEPKYMTHHFDRPLQEIEQPFEVTAADISRKRLTRRWTKTVNGVSQERVFDVML